MSGSWSRSAGASAIPRLSPNSENVTYITLLFNSFLHDFCSIIHRAFFLFFLKLFTLVSLLLLVGCKPLVYAIACTHLLQNSITGAASGCVVIPIPSVALRHTHDLRPTNASLCHTEAASAILYKNHKFYQTKHSFMHIGDALVFVTACFQKLQCVLK